MIVRWERVFLEYDAYLVVEHLIFLTAPKIAVALLPRYVSPPAIVKALIPTVRRYINVGVGHQKYIPPTSVRTNALTVAD
jgi:hypothetical protein